MERSSLEVKARHSKAKTKAKVSKTQTRPEVESAAEAAGGEDAQGEEGLAEAAKSNTRHRVPWRSLRLKAKKSRDSLTM